MRCGSWVCLFAGVLAVGCGGSGGGEATVPVVGNIKVDGEPAPNAVIRLIPQGTTGGQGGGGATDSTGRYEVSTPQGKKGLPPGQYKVTVSRRLNPDGSPPDPNTPPIESKAIETLPAKYSDLTKTELSLNISPDDKRSFDFDLKVKKK
jgi:hypothetical protein